MITMTCECGEQVLYTSMGSYDCQGCTECNTSFNKERIEGEDEEFVWKHKKLESHKWMTKYNQNTGKPYKICQRCYEVEKESYKQSQLKD